MSENAAVIYAEHVYKTFGKTKALIDLSFSVGEATCVGFLGPNGAGKTTMMKILYGMGRPDKREETKISVFGFDSRTDELSIKNFSGVVQQDDNLDVELSVTQNLKIFSRFYGVTGGTALDRIDKLLHFMELQEKRDVKIRELSGGMKRRLVIARALLNNPSLLILDEPTTGLDPQVRQLIWDKLRGLKHEGVTVLLTTHYMEEAFQIADSVVIMDRGKKVLEGNPQKLLDDNIEAYVLEITEPAAAEGLEEGIDPALFRREASESRLLYYSDDQELLTSMSRSLSYHQFYNRKTNLEDLFLAITGRKLSEIQ